MTRQKEKNDPDKDLLHSPDAEESVIGAIMINPDVYDEVSEVITSMDFYDHRCRWTFDAINLNRAEGTPIDLLTVSDALQRMGMLDEVGGPAFLTQLLTITPTSLNAVHYARIIEEKSVRRKWVQQAEKLANIAYDISKPLDIAAKDAEAAMQERPAPSKTNVIQVEAAGTILRDMVTNNANVVVKTSLPNRNRQFGGYSLGLATLVNGDSSTGKSALMLQDAENAAMMGTNALYVTLEEPAQYMIARRVFPLAHVDRLRMKNGTLSDGEKQNLQIEIENYIKTRSHLFFDQTSRTPSAIRRSVRQTRARLVVVDDLRHVRPDNAKANASDTSTLLETFSALKDIAVDENCAMVAIHHFTIEEANKLWPTNQNKPTRNDPPGLDSLAWAKDLRYSVDMWLALVPDWQADITASKVKLIEWVMKDKSGPRLNQTELYFDKTRQWFDDNQTKNQTIIP